MALVRREELEHPTQVSRLRLNLYELPPSTDGAVDGMPSGARGYLLTEDRMGSTTVVATLGLFTDREEALRQLERRLQELRAQSYRPSSSASPQVER